MKITEPLICFDLETTDANQDCGIVEMAALKIYPDGRSERKVWLINPEKQIHPKATEVHGLSNVDVENKPTFKEVAVQIHNFISDAKIFMTYNGNSFDIPILYRHFAAVGIDWNPHEVVKIDVMDIVRKLKPRTLSAMFKEYVGEELEHAHSAEADTVAVLRLFYSIKQAHPEIGESPSEVVKWINDGEESGSLDVDGVFKKIDGNITFGKGKHAGEVVDLAKHKSYLEWQLRADNPPFLPDARAIISKFLNQGK